MKIEEEIVAMKSDIRWLKGLLFAVLAVVLSGFHVADPTLVPWHMP